MKTILILGGFGFIGTNLIKYIDNKKKNEFSVIVFDKLQQHPLGIEFECVKKVYSGDFADIIFLENIFLENKIDIIIHSLSTTVPSSSNNAIFDIESNLIPTIELLNLMVKYQVFNITFISSGGAIYGKGEKPHSEKEEVYPISSYGIIKLAIEKYLFQYADLYSITPLVLRLSNPYGPYHFSNKQGVCNIALNAAYRQKPFLIWGDGSASKDYIFICDFCEIFFMLQEKNISNKIINIGSGIILSLNQILFEIKKLIPNFEWSYTDTSKYDVIHSELNIKKLKSIIGEYTFTSIETGLKLTLKSLIQH